MIPSLRAVRGGIGETLSAVTLCAAGTLGSLLSRCMLPLRPHTWPGVSFTSCPLTSMQSFCHAVQHGLFDPRGFIL